MDSESRNEVATEPPPEGGQSPANEAPGNKAEPVAASPRDDVTMSEGDRICPIMTALMTESGLDMLLTDQAGHGIEIVSNTDYHALYVKDETVIQNLDQFREAMTQFWRHEVLSWASAQELSKLRKSSPFFAPILGRLADEPPQTKALVTEKKKAPADLHLRVRKCVNYLSTSLSLSAPDKSLILTAAEIYGLSKHWHPDNNPVGLKKKVETLIKLLRLLNDQPALARMLLAMYCDLGKKNTTRASAELIGANILTAADLIYACLDLEETLPRETAQAVTRELGRVTGTLFLKEVAVALASMLEAESGQDSSREKSRRVLIYTDRPERIYALETRLRNEGFQPSTTESLEAFVSAFTRRRPDVIVMRLNCVPVYVIRAIQYISARGINIGSIPSFLLVKSTLVRRLASLLEIGIEDIIDTEENLNILMSKIRKVRSQLEAPATPPPTQPAELPGSRGKLSDMSLVGLLQALGPSRRTSRVTVTSDDAPAAPLLVYLNQGNITYAQLGDAVGADAVCRALGWRNGTWVVEQVTEADLPEPNNELPNEAILMEGCRLLDEKAREPAAH